MKELLGVAGKSAGLDSVVLGPFSREAGCPQPMLPVKGAWLRGGQRPVIQEAKVNIWVVKSHSQGHVWGEP